MTEDILFDNLYIGQSPEDAKKFAEETFEIKKEIEEDAKKAEQKAEAEEAGELETVFTQDPVGYIREKVLEFAELAKIDPVFAAKAKPEVAAGLGLVVLFFIGAILSLVSGGSPKPSAVSLSPAHHHRLAFNPHRFSFTSNQRRKTLPHLKARRLRPLPARVLVVTRLAPL